MPELKRNFTQGRMNKDLDERLVPNGEYRDALNIEVNTSEGSNAGTVQSLKGNTLLNTDQIGSTDLDFLTADSHLFSKDAVCVGSIADKAKNKIYYFVTDPHRNYDASWETGDYALNDTYVHAEQDSSGNVDVKHKIYSDYIIEYNESSDNAKYVFVEHVKVNTKLSNDQHAKGDHLHVSNLGLPGDIRPIGIQVGMEVYIKGVKTSVIKIEEDTDSGYNGWRIYTEHDANDLGYSILGTAVAGTSVQFKLPHEKRALAFNHFASKNPGEVITGINIIDDLLFWTDNLTEPKKININRCKYGSTYGPHTDNDNDLVNAAAQYHKNGTRKYPTLLIVNGQIPDNATNARLASLDDYASAINYPFFSYKHATVIKNAPTSSLDMIMSNTTKADIQPKDGNIVVEQDVQLPFDDPNVSSSSFFFDEAGARLTNGQTTPSLTFAQSLDWEEGDVVEFYPEDDEAGFDGSSLVTAIVDSKTAGSTFTFEIQAISTKIIKPLVNFRVRLQQKDPLFEFKFPRFAYRWRYEDGEYSAFSPFSEVAFIPDRFDYHPRKGHNLGMTNNLRYLLLYGFKPITTPLDVVEIDILYKESNSPNIYTVETIKSPSSKTVGNRLKTVDYKGDEGWFGKVVKRETPNTLVTDLAMIGTTSFAGSVIIENGVYYYNITDDFEDVNIKVGDQINFTAGQTGLSGTILIDSFLVSESEASYISLTAGGTAVTSSASTWLYDGSPFEIKRTIARKPAFNIDDPVGSLEIKSDIIHAAVPSNQLLRPYDNVPRKALGQEVTANRIVYANYIHQFNIVGKNDKNTIKQKFKTAIRKRKNIRDNIQYDENTALVDPTTGQTIKWYSPLNALETEAKQPERSLKSLRTYQVGMAYVDEFGRTTPIQTHESGVIKVKKNKADDYNGLTVRLEETDDWPVWATHFKIYVKETSNEYYNLALDRFYDAKDGNVWLSFPSSERNKVDEDTYLILKKQHDNDEFVVEKARYKIIAIENEAPLFVKTKFDTLGTVTPPSFPTDGEPKIDQSHFDLPSSLFKEGSSFEDVANAADRSVRVSNATNTSDWYDISTISEYGGNRRVVVKKPFGLDMSWTTDDGTNTGTLKSSLSVEIASKKVKNLPEFNGRFFVKIHKDAVFSKNILVKQLQKVYIVTDSTSLGYQKNVPDDEKYYRDSNDGYIDIPQQRFFVSKIDHRSEWYPPTGGTRGFKDFPDQNYSTLDIQMHWSKAGQGGIRRKAKKRWGITKHGNNFTNGNDKKLALAEKMRGPGTLFRFKGDTTIYRVKTSGYEWMVENYARSSNNWINSETGARYESNHSVMIRMEFEPSLGTTGADAVGRTGTGYNPFTDNWEGVTVGGTTYEEGDSSGVAWSDRYRIKHYQDQPVEGLRHIEFLEELAVDDSYTSDNPAIFETEPKEDIDLDIYHEASDCLAIDQEFSTYKNRFESSHYYTSYNPLQYYNCFSFANGVESNRIRDDFNAVTIDKGPKVSTVLAEQYKEERRKSGLIYSGIYNSISGVNNLNQFIQAEKITKDLNPTYGSIQKLWSKDTNLTALCEDRVINILANKDALFNADGNANVTSTNRVLGNAKPYGGDYGISTDPSSFAYDEYRAYFTDKARGAVLRLSAQGLVPISDMGMRDYFKDAFRAKDITLVGSYDDNKGLYNLTIRSKHLETLSTTDDEDDTGLTVINTGPIPTVGNPLGNWFRYGGITNNWAEWIETNGASSAQTPPNFIGNTGQTKRGWAGIRASGTPTHPVGIEHGGPGEYGANPTLENPITLWFDKITTGYNIMPATDSTPNWNSLINALNTHGPNNVYLYQTNFFAHSPLHNPALGATGLGVIQAFINWPNNWTYTHQPETVYSIESIFYDTVKEAYEVKVNWLVGWSGYQDSNMFKWSLQGPFEVQDDDDINDFASDGLDDTNTGLVNITASYSEKSKGWVTFQSWLKESGLSLNDKYYTFRGGNIYEHHSSETRNNFYGIQHMSKVCVLFNDIPSSVKHFSSLNYEGTQSRVLANITDDEFYNNTPVDGWYSSYIETDLETGYIPEFKRKEGKWFNFIRSNKSNNITNFDPKTFSTQGIGKLSAISSVVSSTDNTATDTAVVRNKVTIKDTGDTD
jgi:hypothetical protein